LGKSSAGFSALRKWLENKAIEKRKNYCSKVKELDWRRAKASAEKLGKLTIVDLSVDWRRAKA